MPLVDLDTLHKAYGANEVIRGASWRIEPGDRIGLVGLNGCGKTTLFRLILGDLLPDRGKIHRQRDLRIGYLPQDPVLHGEATVLKTALEGFQGLLDLGRRLTDLEHQISAGQDGEAVLNQYGRLREQYERGGGYALDARAKAVLFGLGFSEGDLDQPANILSGGQKNRLALAKLLAGQPDLLLLDEPTNHLDLDAIEWLEGFLAGCGSTCVVVSHDRYFLDRTVTQIAELDWGLVEAYSGNYTAYVGQRQTRRDRQRKLYEAQQDHIARTEDYVRRNIAGQKTKQAQSRRRSLAKLERIDRPTDARAMSVRFAASRRGGDRVLQIEGVSKGYDDRLLFGDLSLILWREDRLGIVGPNGSGKTTLLKVATKQIPGDTGVVSFGAGVQVGYYEQTREDLNPNATVLEEIWTVTPQVPSEEIRTFLGAFLFSGDDVEQRIESLSGGEQSRVALAKLMRRKVNLLVLDEPTNHLDIPSRMVLEAALERYDGTLITVSHDRYFLDRIVNRLIVLGEGHWRLVEGNYETYLRQQAASEDDGPAEDPEKTARKAAYEGARKTQREQQRRERRAQHLQDRIEALEGELGRVDDEMAQEDLKTDWARLQELSRERSRLQKEIADCFAEWESVEAGTTETRTV